MFSTDQTHLRRYFATLGVAIFAGTLSLAGLFLKLQQDLLVTKSTLANLTPSARDSLLKRQEYLSIATAALPWFVLVGLLTGATLSVYGLVGWARRQRIIDERENLGLDRERFEFRELTREEQSRKLERDVKESTKPGESDNGSSVLPETDGSSREDARAAIVEIESSLRDKLREVYPSNNVISPAFLGSPDASVEVDAAVVHPMRRSLIWSQPLLFEIKYANSISSANKELSRWMMQVRRAVEYASPGGNKTGLGVLIIVLPDSSARSEIIQLRDRANQYAARGDVSGFYVGTKSDFLSMSGQSLVFQLGMSPY